MQIHLFYKSLEPSDASAIVSLLQKLITDYLIAHSQYLVNGFLSTIICVWSTIKLKSDLLLIETHFLSAPWQKKVVPL